MKLPSFSMLLTRGVVTAALILLLACPAGLFPQAAAQDHIVSPQSMQQQVQSASASRQTDIATITGFLSSPAADRAMRSAHMDPVQVRTAIPTLSNQELTNLATRAANAQQQFAAGFLGPISLSVLIVGIAIIIIVVAIWH